MSMSMRQIYVKPVDGRLVHKPGTREQLAQPGEFVPYDPFWVRRINDGDVVEALPPAPAKTAKSSKE